MHAEVTISSVFVVLISVLCVEYLNFDLRAKFDALFRYLRAVSLASIGFIHCFAFSCFTGASAEDMAIEHNNLIMDVDVDFQCLVIVFGEVLFMM